MEKLIYTEFKTDFNVVGEYAYDDSIKEYRLRIKSKVRKADYYSYLNQIREYFDEQILPTIELGHKLPEVGRLYWTKDGMGNVVPFNSSYYSAIISKDEEGIVTPSVCNNGDSWNIGLLARKIKDIALTEYGAKFIKY